MSQEPLYGGIDMMNLFESFDKEVAEMRAQFESSRARMDERFNEAVKASRKSYAERVAAMNAAFDAECARMDAEYDREVAKMRQVSRANMEALDTDEGGSGYFNSPLYLNQQAHENAMRQHNDFMNQVHIINMHHHNMF